MTRPPARQRLYDLGIQPLIDQHGQNLALTFVLACIQHRTGRPYDAWDGNTTWADLTEADVKMAGHLLNLAHGHYQPEPPTGHWAEPE